MGANAIFEVEINKIKRHFKTMYFMFQNDALAPLSGSEAGSKQNIEVLL